MIFILYTRVLEILGASTAFFSFLLSLSLDEAVVDYVKYVATLYIHSFRYMPSSEAEKKALTVLPVIHTVTALVLDAFSERLQSSFEEATGDNTVCQEEDEVEVFNDVVSFPGKLLQCASFISFWILIPFP